MLKISARIPHFKFVASGLERKERGYTPDEATDPLMKHRRAISFKVQRLNDIKLKITGKVPRLLSAKMKPAAAVEEEAPAEAIAIKPSAESAQTAQLPYEAVITVVPTPRQREIRPQRVKAAPLEPAAPKPLKVIRRRREEAPKIFETPPKTLPKAMLEGIDLDPEADADN